MDVKHEVVNTGIPIDFQGLAHGSSHYATNFLVQRGESEYFIGFVEVRPPIVFGPSGVVPASVPAAGACFVSFSRSRLPDLIRVLQQAFEDDPLLHQSATSE